MKGRGGREGRMGGRRRANWLWTRARFASEPLKTEVRLLNRALLFSYRHACISCALHPCEPTPSHFPSGDFDRFLISANFCLLGNGIVYSPAAVSLSVPRCIN